MLGSNVIEITIRVMLVFILFSTFYNAIRKDVESRIAISITYLDREIHKALDDQDKKDFLSKRYNHSYINGNTIVIPVKNFAWALGGYGRLLAKMYTSLYHRCCIHSISRMYSAEYWTYKFNLTL